MTAAAARLVRSWAWLYTLGLSAELRLARRAELESDLWEQAADGRARGRSRGREGALTCARMVLGVPADLGWRLEHSRVWTAPSAVARAPCSRRCMPAERAAGWLGRRGLPGLPRALGWIYVLLSAVVLLSIPLNEDAAATPGQLTGLRADLACVGVGAAVGIPEDA